MERNRNNALALGSNTNSYKKNATSAAAATIEELVNHLEAL
jgi:hypothetical protein